MQAKLSIGELSELSGVSRRTIHYYVKMKVLAPPAGSGRGHYYTQAHLERLLEVKTLQEEGFSLVEISRGKRRKIEEQAPLPYSPTLVTKLEVISGIEILFTHGLGFPLTPGRLARIGNAFTRILKKELGFETSKEKLE